MSRGRTVSGGRAPARGVVRAAGAFVAALALSVGALAGAVVGGVGLSSAWATSANVVASPAVGTAPIEVAVTPDGSKAYVTNFASGSVSVVDVATLAVTSTITVGSSPFGVALRPDGSKAYVANFISNSVSVIDVATSTVTATVSLGTGARPYGLAVTPDGMKAYVTKSNADAIAVVDLGTNTVTSTIALAAGTTPIAVAVTPNGAKAYVTNSNADSLSVIDTSTNAVTTIALASGAAPQQVAITPDGTKAYVTNSGLDSVSVIDIATNAVSTTVSLGGSGLTTMGVVITPDGSKAYVSNYTGNSVSVIDTTTNTVTDTLTGLTDAYGIAVASNGTTFFTTEDSGGVVNIFTTAVAPGAPGTPTAMAGVQSATVTWTAPTSGGTPATYTVTAGPGGATCTATHPTLTCAITGLSAGVSYTFTVTATNLAGTSPASSASLGVVPTAPSGGGSSGGGGTTSTPVTVPSPSPTPTATPAPTDPLAPKPTNLALGASVLLVDGVPAPVTVKPNARKKATGLVVDGPGFSMTLAGRGDVDDPLGLSDKQALVLESEPGTSRSGTTSRLLPLAKTTVQPVAVSSGSGFAPTSPVKFFLLADTFLGTLTTDASGGYAGSVPVPAGIAPGSYTLQVNGFSPSGAVRSLSIGVRVTATTTRAAKAEVFFAPLSADLTSVGKTRLDALVKKTGKASVRTTVIGFVQPVGTTGNDATLSKARAESVARYLRGKGLRGAYVIEGNGRAREAGADARRVEVTVTYRM